MTDNKVNTQTLNEQERTALRLVSQILTEIRFTCSGTADEITQSDVRYMHDLADAARHIPRAVAERREPCEASNSLVTLAMNRAAYVYAELNKPNPHAFAQMVLYEDDEVF